MATSKSTKKKPVKAAPKKSTPKKSAPKKSTPKKSSPKKSAAPVRGIALVELALAKREDATPTPPKALSRLKLGSRPLTPALRRWLESDGEFFTLGAPQSLAEMIASEFGEEQVEGYQPAIELLPEPIVLFEGWGADSRRFIYLGKPDSHGELPVFTLDTDDGIFLCLNGPVDVWLAQQAGALEDEHVYGHLPKAYEPSRTEHAKLNFDGYKQFADFQLLTEAPSNS
jgi:hypothetical protein